MAGPAALIHGDLKSGPGPRFANPSSDNPLPLARPRGSLRRVTAGASMAVNKIYPDATAALAGLLRDGMTIMSGGFGLCGIPSRADRGDPGQRREGPDDHLQQRRHRRGRAGRAAANPAGPQDDQLLCRRERDLRASSTSPASWRSNSTRKARWPSASAPAAPAFRRSSPPPAPARRSPRARRPRNSTAAPM